mmetsp:Transcript_14984/g.28997  ORF Transcript_14984/g.28997 Transcript_14984/m.28997 type:complete len:90 (+) Transcript_14984:238-507(+)
MTRFSTYKALAGVMLLLAIATTCFASDLSEQQHDEMLDGSTIGNNIRKLMLLQLPAIKMPIAQGRCAGTFTREIIPCYISQYSLLASFN